MAKHQPLHGKGLIKIKPICRTEYSGTVSVLFARERKCIYDKQVGLEEQEKGLLVVKPTNCLMGW